MFRLIILVASAGAILSALAILLGGPGTRLGLWEYGDAFGIMRKAAPFAMGFTAAAIVALALAAWRERGLIWLPVVAVLLGGISIYGPMQMRAAGQANPVIHDITTDFDNPPQILAAAELPRKNSPDYVGAEQAPRADEGVTIADAQRKAFPDIVPLTFDAETEVVVDAAKRILSKMKMDLLAEGPLEAPDGWRLEAVHTSAWFGFKDDFIVRIAPGDGGGVRVDVRSKSRVGLSDLGANASRIRTFTEKLSAALK